MIKQTIENFGRGHGGGGHHHGNGYHHYGNGYHNGRRYRNPYFYNNLGYYKNYYCDKDKIILNDTDVCYNRSENEIDNCDLKSCNIEKYEHKYEKKCEKKFKCSLVGIC